MRGEKQTLGGPDKYNGANQSLKSKLAAFHVSDIYGVCTCLCDCPSPCARVCVCFNLVQPTVFGSVYEGRREDDVLKIH